MSKGGEQFRPDSGKFKCERSFKTAVIRINIQLDPTRISQIQAIEKEEANISRAHLYDLIRLANAGIKFEEDR